MKVIIEYDPAVPTVSGNMALWWLCVNIGGFEAYRTFICKPTQKQAREYIKSVKHSRKEIDNLGRC